MHPHITEFDIDQELEPLRGKYGVNRAWHGYLLGADPTLFRPGVFAEIQRLDQLEMVRVLLQIRDRTQAQETEWADRLTRLSAVSNEWHGSWDFWPETYRELFRHAATKHAEFYRILTAVDDTLLELGYC